MIEVRRYDIGDLQRWNDFLKASKNGTFLFDRNYLSYHADRFQDHSVMIYENGELVALLPGNESNGEVISHGGLSYGGMVLSPDARLADVCRYFRYVLMYFAEVGVAGLIYKCIPLFYASSPAQEDIYVMYLLQAALIRRDSGCASPLIQRSAFQQRRVRSMKKAQKLGISVVESNDPAGFWEHALVPNLKERYNLKPVHTVEEMKLLMARFPMNIRVFEARHASGLMAGTVIYETPLAAHAQYIAATSAGKDAGALDLLFYHLLQEVYSTKAFFSFGISNEDSGKYLNRGLQDWKEGWGGRTYPVDFYKVETKNYSLLAAYE